MSTLGRAVAFFYFVSIYFYHSLKSIYYKVFDIKLMEMLLVCVV